MLALLFLVARSSGGGTTVRHLGDIVVNSFGADRTETVTSPRSSFKVSIATQPAIIQVFSGDPTQDFITVYGRATG